MFYPLGVGLSAGGLIAENGWFAVSPPRACPRLDGPPSQVDAKRDLAKVAVIDYSSPFPGDNPVHNQVVKSKRHNLSAAYVDVTKF